MTELTLETSYMGLSLRNPIIVASSDLTKTAEGMKKCEDAGAGAIVLKSLFEEQFLVEGDIPESDASLYPEALDYMRSGGLMEYAPARICGEIEEAKKSVGIPIIASINCQTSSLWPRFARQVMDAGADGLELNIYDLPIDPKISCADHDSQYFQIIGDVRKSISIPVSVKLIPQISSLPFWRTKWLRPDVEPWCFSTGSWSRISTSKNSGPSAAKARPTSTRPCAGSACWRAGSPRISRPREGYGGRTTSSNRSWRELRPCRSAPCSIRKDWMSSVISWTGCGPGWASSSTRHSKISAVSCLSRTRSCGSRIWEPPPIISGRSI